MNLYPFKDFIVTLKDGVSRALRMAGYDEQDDMMKVKSMQKKWRAGFTGTVLNPEKWDIIQVGTGQNINVVNGTMQITTGTTPNAETIIRSKEDFTIPVRAMINVALSQRIANQNFYVELVSVGHESGEPDSNSLAGWHFDGTSATTARYVVNGGDQPPLSTTGTTQSTATAGAIFEIEPTVDEVWFFSRAIDSTAGRANSFVRHSQIPNPNLKYKLQIRVVNGAVAPASSTTFSSQFANVSDYAELTAEITAGRGSGVAGQAIATTPTGGTISTVTTTYVSPKSLVSSETTANINTGATFGGTVRDCGATLLYNTYRLRMFSNQPLRVDVRCGTSATLTSNRVQQTISIPADTVVVVDVPVCARYIGVQVTNVGTANTTTVEVFSVLLGNV